MGLKLICFFYIIILIKTSNGEVFTSFLDLIRLVDTENEVILAMEEYIAGLEEDLMMLKRVNSSEALNSEMRSIMGAMGRLSGIDNMIVEDIDGYISTHEEYLNILKNKFVEMESAHNFVLKSPEEFLFNPINAYLLIKRLFIDWNLPYIMTNDAIGKEILNKLANNEEIVWPDGEDLNGVAVAITRLQDTYMLKTEDLANGNILGVKTAYRELNAHDCFEIGVQTFKNEDFYHTLLWMNEALKRYEEGVYFNLRKTDILAYLSYSNFKEGKMKLAFQYTEARFNEEPEDASALNDWLYYKDLLNVESADQLSEEEGVQEFTYRLSEPTFWWKKIYERLCRGEGNIPLEKSKHFTCFYKKGPSKFLLLAPIKTEILYINPTVYVFHEAMYDDEIKNIKELATPNLRRALVHSGKDGESLPANYRISKTTWIKSDKSQQMITLHKRIEDVTDLNLETAEALQVNIYGVGGQYEPHTDHSKENRHKTFGDDGNRIATLLFYASDVQLGGATVYPELELSVWPKKGSAAFWYNLHPSGEGDDLTLHAACPVLVGQKLVNNKWFHERGQEFRRPCSLNYDDY